MYFSAWDILILKTIFVIYLKLEFNCTSCICIC